MTLQILVDGLIAGAMIGLGAIGVTLTYSILRFANFAHGELVSWGAYLALAASSAIGLLSTSLTAPLAPFSFGWSLPLGTVAAIVLTALLALLVDAVLFGPLRRRRGAVIILVMASFGAALTLRSLLEFIFTSGPRYFTQELQIAIRLGGGVRATPDQMLAIGVAGIDVRATVRIVWILGAALACVAGVMAGLLVQIRPQMGFDLLLPLFAAAILGGIGSVPGAMLAGFIVGIGEALTVRFVGAEWRAALSFMILVAILLVRPQGILGRADR